MPLLGENQTFKIVTLVTCMVLGGLVVVLGTVYAVLYCFFIRPHPLQLCGDGDDTEVGYSGDQGGEQRGKPKAAFFLWAATAKNKENA